jgi:hypothetical protein
MAVQDGAEQAATPAMGQLMTTVAAQVEWVVVDREFQPAR